MMDWLESVLPPGYADAVLWVAVALLLLLVVLLVLRLLRRLTGGTFVSGGRARKARLAVMDAAPVDSRRRLVLVRRDDVEHLILIGGPTDLVVEQDIRVAGRPAPRPVARSEQPQQAPQDAAEPASERARPAPPPRPVAPPPAPTRAPATHVTLPRPAMPMSPPPPPPGTSIHATPPRTTPAPQAASTTGSLSAQNGAPLPRAATAQDLDSQLLGELQASLGPGTAPAKKRSSADIEEEMNKLLGELTGKR